MAITETQVLNLLQRLKDNCTRGSKKYYTIGAMRILVRKQVITITDILEEFPELNT